MTTEAGGAVAEKVVAWMDERQAWLGLQAPTTPGLRALVLADDYDALQAEYEQLERVVENWRAIKTDALARADAAEAQLAALRSRCEGLADEWEPVPKLRAPYPSPSELERQATERRCARKLRELLGAGGSDGT